VFLVDNRDASLSVYQLQEKEKARKAQEAQKKEKALKEKEDKQKAKEKKDKEAKEKKKGRGRPGKDSLPEAFEDEDEEVVEETQMDDDDDDDARRCSSPDRAHSQTLPSFKGRLLTLRAWPLIQSPHQQRRVHLLLLCMSLREQLTTGRPLAGNKKPPPKAAAADFDFDGEESNVPPPSLGKRSDKKDRPDNKESKASSKKPKTDASKSSSKMPQTYKPSTKATESSAPEYGTLNLVVENPSVEDPSRR
jgi:hypothetical protein